MNLYINSIFHCLGVNVSVIGLLLLAICLILSGMLTSGWQVLEVSTGERIERGLVRNCDRIGFQSNFGAGGWINSNGYDCYWKSSSTGFNPLDFGAMVGYQRDPFIYDWQVC